MKGFRQEEDELEEFLDFMEEDLENIRRVRRYFREENLEGEFIIHAKSETAEESASNIGVEKDRIVKTLVFKSGEKFVAVLCPGDSRVSERKLEKTTGEDVRMAKPEEVRESTGYVVGGVSPFDLEIKVFMEEKLLEKEKIKPAAGSRVVGVKVDPESLKRSLNAKSVSLTED